MGISRSENMSRIRAKNTSPELVVRKALTNAGVRYRLQVRTADGRPDLVIPRYRLAIFIDGCFWHGCPDHYVRPRSRVTFWADKLRENAERDRRQTLAFERDGWKVLRFWEHQVFDSPDDVADRVLRVIKRGGRVAKLTSWRLVHVEPVDPEGKIEKRYQEDLRNAEKTRCIQQTRHTRKWGTHRTGLPPSVTIRQAPRREER